jgi:hypothetical protein
MILTILLIFAFLNFTCGYFSGGSTTLGTFGRLSYSFDDADMNVTFVLDASTVNWIAIGFGSGVCIMLNL